MSITVAAAATREVRAQSSNDFPLTLSDLRKFLDRCDAVGIPSDSQFYAQVVVKDTESRVTVLRASLYERLPTPAAGQVAKFTEGPGEEEGGEQR